MAEPDPSNDMELLITNILSLLKPYTMKNTAVALEILQDLDRTELNSLLQHLSEKIPSQTHRDCLFIQVWKRLREDRELELPEAQITLGVGHENLWIYLRANFDDDDVQYFCIQYAMYMLLHLIKGEAETDAVEDSKTATQTSSDAAEESETATQTSSDATVKSDLDPQFVERIRHNIGDLNTLFEITQRLTPDEQTDELMARMENQTTKTPKARNVALRVDRLTDEAAQQAGEDIWATGKEEEVDKKTSDADSSKQSSGDWDVGPGKMNGRSIMW